MGGIDWGVFPFNRMIFTGWILLRCDINVEGFVGVGLDGAFSIRYGWMDG